MLSRVAERLYWMARYLERVEDTARLIDAYSHVILDLPKGAEPGWSVLLETLEAEQEFHSSYKAAAETSVMKFLIANADTTKSLRFSMRLARENVRTTRDALPSQVWELVNECYLFSEDQCGHSIARKNRSAYLAELIGRLQQINGLIESSVLRDQPFWYLRLGRLIERADMTTRIVDAGVTAMRQRAVDQIPEIPSLWGSLLRSVSGVSAYRRTVGPVLDAESVVDFVLTNAHFPRSLVYCTSALEELIDVLQGPPGLSRASRAIASQMRRLDVTTIDASELSLFIDGFQHDLGELNAGFYDAWFSYDMDKTIE